MLLEPLKPQILCYEDKIKAKLSVNLRLKGSVSPKLDSVKLKAVSILTPQSATN